MQESILLTYDLCKFLLSLDVVVGGSYILEDGHYHTDDIPNYSIKALKLFQSKNIVNNEEFIKIIHDKEIIEFLFANTDMRAWSENYYIIDKLIIDFFKDFPFEKFVSLTTSKG